MITLLFSETRRDGRALVQGLGRALSRIAGKSPPPVELVPGCSFGGPWELRQRLQARTPELIAVERPLESYRANCPGDPLGEDAREALDCTQAPVLLLPRRVPGAGIPEGVAPRRILVAQDDQDLDGSDLLEAACAWATPEAAIVHFELVSDGASDPEERELYWPEPVEALTSRLRLVAESLEADLMVLRARRSGKILRHRWSDLLIAEFDDLPLLLL